MSIKTARIDARCNSDIKETISVAADMMGLSVSDFLISTTLQKAQEIIAKANHLRLNNQQRDNFLDSISGKPKKPNKALREAAVFYKDNLKK